MLWILIPAVAALVLGLAAGYFLAPGADARLSASPEEVVVTAHAELRSPALEQTRVSLDGSTVQVVAMPPSWARAAVVTASPLSIGDSIEEGGLVVAISGDPRFALTSSTPFFRDMTLGMTGPDISVLNAALARVGLLADGAGEAFTAETAAAVAHLYRQSGFTAPGGEPGTVFPFDHIVQVPSGGATVTQVTPANTVVEPGTPVLTAQASVTTVRSRVDTVTAERVSTGLIAELTLVGSADSVAGVVTEVSPFRTDGGEFPGHDIVVELDTPLVPASATTGTLSILVDTSSEVAVPVTAIRSQGATLVVWREEGSTFAPVTVTVTTESEGWALLGDDSPIEVGDTVRVSP